MKKLFILLALCMGTLSFSQEEDYSKLNWLTDFDQAAKESQISNKPILMYFTGSDWCGPCKSLKTDFFNSDAFIVKSENFVLLEIDMPRRSDIITPEQKAKNIILIKKYNPNGGYPNIVALNKKLQVIGELSRLYLFT
ncbi:thioredoxin family protein [Lacinutrix neustonica]|uniref:Thioredoxin family protein n=1 Tax=Lacinutrix neustonica TaxID=2980107 RepID=A0A9E8MXH1_9FLAO|nr:thioredoxin family protein [Lacinutrix neustonica]WAC02695.1 thioredoxin family protein [Lacinutrix neustonica]